MFTELGYKVDMNNVKYLDDEIVIPMSIGNKKFILNIYGKSHGKMDFTITNFGAMYD